MSQEYSQHQLERMVVGPEENPHVQFYERSTMNPDLSKAAGKRVYQTRLMIKKTQPGVTDFAAYVAQKADISKWTEEYQYFLNTKSDVGSPLIDIIPGIEMDVIQELMDYGLNTITKLCAAKTLPVHLQPAQASARRLNEVLQHEQQENKAKEVPTPDRPLDAVGVGQRSVPAGAVAEVGAITAGPYQGGRLNGSEGRTGADDGDDTSRAEKEKVFQKEIALPDSNWRLSF